MSSAEVKEINEELQKYLDNFSHEDYDDYLDNFKKTLEDRKKCQKSKKCAFDFTVNQSNIIKKKVIKLSTIFHFLNIPTQKKDSKKSEVK